MRVPGWRRPLRVRRGSANPIKKAPRMKTQFSQSSLVQNRPGAIVLGGNFVGLGVVRSLGARGIPTWVIDSDASKSIAQFSRYTKRFMICKERVHELLLEEGRRHRLNGWVVFPVSDEYV